MIIEKLVFRLILSLIMNIVKKVIDFNFSFFIFIKLNENFFGGISIEESFVKRRKNLVTLISR
jgi:hypothetical protein